MKLKTNLILTAAFAFYSILACAADTSSHAIPDRADTTYSIAKKADGNLILLPPQDPLCAIGLTNVGNANIQEFALYRTLGRAAVIMYINGQNKHLAKTCFNLCQEWIEDDTRVTRLLDNQADFPKKMMLAYHTADFNELTCILYDSINRYERCVCFYRTSQSHNALVVNESIFSSLLNASDTSKGFYQATQIIENVKQPDLKGAVQFARQKTEGQPFGPALFACLDRAKLVEHYKPIEDHEMSEPGAKATDDECVIS